MTRLVVQELVTRPLVTSPLSACNTNTLRNPILLSNNLQLYDYGPALTNNISIHIMDIGLTWHTVMSAITFTVVMVTR